MAKLFKNFKTNYTVTDFVKKDSSGVSYVVLNNGFFNNTYNEILHLSLENQTTLLNTIVFNDFIELIKDNNLDASGFLILENNLIFNIENLINANNDLNINSILNINSNSEITYTSLTEINQNISLNQVSYVNNNVNLEINQTTNLLTDSNFNEKSGGIFNDSVLYLTDNNIEINSNKLVTLLTELYQSATFDNFNLIEYSKKIETQIENRVLFDLFLEAFNYISLSGNTITEFEVLNIIDNVFNLNTNTNIVFSSLTNRSVNSFIEINANILFDGFVFRVDYKKREFVYLKSKITNNKKTLSLTTNYKENFSNLDNKKILKSNITNDYICKSLITNNKKLKSKING